MMLDALSVFANNFNLESGQKCIPMLFGLICIISQKCTGMEARSESKWGLKDSIIYSDEKGEELPRNENRQMWSAMWKEGIQKLIEVCGMK